jgi:hypothetical protein
MSLGRSRACKSVERGKERGAWGMGVESLGCLFWRFLFQAKASFILLPSFLILLNFSARPLGLGIVFLFSWQMAERARR